ncbi:GyrI-like domain-containing protein [Gammaproteobacteria bacterium]|nr:GyrI-like domain-containing protein [Gammaproteobacteria bacterium]
MFDIVEISEMKVIGLSTKTSNAIEATDEGRIIKLHQDFMKKKPSTLDSRFLAVYSHYEDAEKGSYQYAVGHVGEDASGLESIIIPAGRYLCVPSDRGMLSEVLPAVWQKIWRLSAEGSLGVVRAHDIDFEFHNYSDEAGLDAQVDVYLSIIEE